MKIVLLLCFACLFTECSGDKFVRELLEKLLADYNKIVRPVNSSKDVLFVQFGAQLCRIIDIDEVNQVLTTSLWLEMQWTDSKLVWDPSDYGGVTAIKLPSDQIYIPDIVLYNNADGQPNIDVVSMVIVDNTGFVTWMPPSIYKSFCQIDIEYFPYDLQHCSMKFGAWSNDGSRMDLIPIRANQSEKILNTECFDPKIGRNVKCNILQQGLGLNYYQPSAEWDLLNATSRRSEVEYSGCCGSFSYVDITFQFTLRRKAIFYTWIVTIPCLLIANTTPFVFLIPPCEHKMTFSISVFVALSVFYLVLIDLLPPTSVVLPLVGKFLVYTLFMITLSILVSVMHINIYRRHAYTAPMSEWQRYIFTRLLPKLLRMQRLKDEDGMSSSSICSKMSEARLSVTGSQMIEAYRGTTATIKSPRLRLLSLTNEFNDCTNEYIVESVHLFRRLKMQLSLISAKFEQEKLRDRVTDEWRLMSLVSDRIFFIIYIVANIAATILFFMNAQGLIDTRPALESIAPTKPISGVSVRYNITNLKD